MALIATAALSVSAQSPMFNEMSYSADQTEFNFSGGDKAAKSVMLRIYRSGDSEKPFKTVKMKKSGNAYKATVSGDLKGCFYTFDAGRGEFPGYFAKAVGVNGRRGAVIDLADTDPEGWAKDRRPSIKMKDLVLYELHHRDFSIDESSGLEYKGKFLALTEEKAIRHLTDLGVNAVHVLPSFDYASVDETRLNIPQYNWGYDPQNYNVPEGGYSTNPYDPCVRINEFKQMVQALHAAGIKVILDVVYNHTFNTDRSNFTLGGWDSAYRYRADGSYSNGSGCGNETASDTPKFREYMIESLRYWVDEYHLDGFRVDLMGVHDIATMNEIRKALPEDVIIYGEGWSAGECAYPHEKLGMKAHIKQMPGIAAFSDDLRDALRGPFSDDHKGAFLAGIPGEEESIKAGIVGCISHPDVDYAKVNYSKEPWAQEPTQMISYVSCHDDMCLVDRLRSSIPNISDDELIRLDLLAQTAVFTSQGVPFILSGEEMLRDKKGVHNSFESPDSINHLDWSNLETRPEVMNYYSRLIAMRKHHRAFRMGNAELVRENVRFLPTEDCLVAFVIKGTNVGDSWHDILVVLNANKEPRTLEVPLRSYTVVCRNLLIDEKGIDRVYGNKVVIPAQSALIMHD